MDSKKNKHLVEQQGRRRSQEKMWQKKNQWEWRWGWDVPVPVTITFEIGWAPDDEWIPDSYNINGPYVVLNLDRLVEEAGLGPDVLSKLKSIVDLPFNLSNNEWRVWRDILAVGEIGFDIRSDEPGDFEVLRDGLADCDGSTAIANVLWHVFRAFCPGLSEDDIDSLIDDAITSEISDNVRFRIESIIENTEYSDKAEWVAQQLDL